MVIKRNCNDLKYSAFKVTRISQIFGISNALQLYRLYIISKQIQCKVKPLTIKLELQSSLKTCFPSYHDEILGDQIITHLR